LGKKKFDQELYDLYDDSAKNAVIKSFTKMYPGIEITKDPFGKYGIDLKLQSRTMLMYIDVEVRPGWTGEFFPFDTVHLPERKIKLIPKDGRTFFLSLNKELTKGLLFAIKIENNLINVRNKYVKDGENFYSVPVESCLQLIL
jgi:hypothetical protein